MALKWTFLSYNAGRFHQVFGKASDTDERGLLKVLEFELGCTPEDDVGLMAKKLAHQGVIYHGLKPREAEMLDQILAVAFGPEGLWTELELEAESTEEGLSPKLVDEMLKRSEGKLQLELLPALRKGRRYGAVDLNPECNYVLFDRNEVVKLAAEARAVLELPGPWSTPTAANEIMDGLIMVCEYVARKRKALAGVRS